MKKIFLSLVSVILVCTLLISCKKPENNDNTQDNTPKDDAPVISQDTEETEKYISPYTGLACSDENIATKRPVAMMINNIKKATPQMGLANADIIYECLVEGGITRLMCIFSEYENLPETGSVRSSRDYYIDLAQCHDAIYSHCGGSTYAYDVLSERDIDNLDGVRDGSISGCYWKNKERLRTMGYEHASMTDGKALCAAISQKGYRTSVTEGFTQPLNFGEKDTEISGNTCTGLNVEFSSYAQSFFIFDADTKEYLKGQYGKAHVDGYTNKPLSFKNIILLSASYSRISGDEYGRLSLDFTGTGKGYYVTDGKYKEITWSKSSRTSKYALYESDGKTPLILNPGKSYIGIIPGTDSVSFDFKEVSSFE